MIIRKLLPSETAKLRDHLLRLTLEQRSRRFMGTLDDAAVREHCRTIDWFHAVVIGFFDASSLRGAAELQVADSRPPILCEVAISVERPWQDQGIATELLGRVLMIARNRSSRGVQVRCFGDNNAIRHVAQKFGARFRGRGDESEAEIPSSAPTYWSLQKELMDDALGWMRFWLDEMSQRPAQVRLQKAG